MDVRDWVRFFNDPPPKIKSTGRMLKLNNLDTRQKKYAVWLLAFITPKIYGNMKN